MPVMTVTTSVPDLYKNIKPAAEQLSAHEAQVFTQGARNQKLWSIHTGGTKDIPARDPLFLTQETSSRVVREIAQSLSQAFKGNPTLSLEGYRKAIKLALTQLRNNVLEEKTRGGGAMTPLSSLYAAAKARKGGASKPILVDTGELLRSLRTRVVKTGGE